MRGLLIFNLGRRSRMLAALALAAMALAILLLGIGSESPTALASELPPARLENVTAAITYYVYLPIMFRSPGLPPGAVFVDDFSNKSSGWIRGSYELNGRKCSFDYTSSNTYRVTISKEESSSKAPYCLMWNDKIPRQFYGTFKVKVKRTSDSANLRYGFQFDTAKDSTEETGTRWALEAYPKDDSDCDDEPYFWLTALKGGDRKFFNANLSPDNHECTTAIDTAKNAWNELAAVRDGQDIKVYIRHGTSRYSHKYEDVYRFSDDEATKYGYFQLRIVATSDSTVSAEFDDLQILNTTSAPW